MMDRVQRCNVLNGSAAPASEAISIFTGASVAERSSGGATFKGSAPGATTVRIVSLPSPQSIDQLPSAIAEDANSFTTNMLATARNMANSAYHNSRHGR